MIHSEEFQASAALEASNIWTDNTADSIIISDMRIDDKGNIQYKNNGGSWTTVMSPSSTLTVSSTAHKDVAVDFEGLKTYDKKIKEYIDKRIDEKLSELRNSKYKVMVGESD